MNTLRPLHELVQNVSDAFNPLSASTTQYLLYSFEAHDLGKKPVIVAESEMKSGKKIVRAGDVLFAKLNPRIPRAWLVANGENDLTKLCSTEFVVLRSNNAREFDPEYLAWTLLAPQFLAPIQAQVSSSTKSHQRVRPDFILDQRVPFRPHNQQRRVVSRIKECLSRVEEMQRLREETETEVAVLENSWLRQRFEELSDDWPEMELGSISEIRGGTTLPKGTPTPSLDIDWLLVKVGDMNLPGNELEILSAREYLCADAPDDAWPVGTVVFPKRGGAIATNKKRLLGRAALLDPNLMGVIADAKQMRPAFLLAQFKLVDLATLTSGSTVPQLNRKDLAPLPFVVPDLPTQDTVISQAKNFSTKVREMAEANAHTAELQALRESILREAFAGNL